MSNKITISNNTVNLINDLNQEFIDQYIYYHLKEQETQWASAYSVLKAPNWPSCITYNDFYKLSNDIKDECIHVHSFSPEIWKARVINNAKEHYYQDKNEISVRKPLMDFLIKHVTLLKSKAVIDIACRYGAISFLLNQNGCDRILGIDVRDSSIKIANSIKDDLNVGNAVNFTTCDVHNYSKLSDHCKGKDVILFLGILNHIHDHFEVLKTLSASNATHIFIETIEPNEVINSTIPLVSWNLGKTFESLSGYVENMDTILEGHPNQAWIDMVMNLLGFKKLDEEASSVPCFNYTTNHKISLFEKVK